MSRKAGTPAKVLLIDDHPLIRHGLRQLLGGETGLVVSGEASTTAEAVTAFENARPDIAVVDITLGADDGLELVKQLAARWPRTFILVLSMHGEQLYAERALRAGAHGYLMKQEPPEQVVKAIRRILDGGVYVSEEMQAQWLQRVARGETTSAGPMERLTDRELAVYRLIGSGLGTRAIARQLHLSVKTVESYREGIKSKLAIGSATELVQRATLWLHGEAGS